MNTLKRQNMQSPSSYIWILTGGFLLMFVCLTLFGPPGKRIKGMYFTNPSSLSVTQGKIVLSQRGGGKYYSYRINYEYSVGGRIYHSELVDYGSTYDHTPQMAQSYLSKYPVGKIVKVFYDHNDPSFAILDPYAHLDNEYGLALDLALPIVLFAVTAVSLHSFYRLKKSGQLIKSEIEDTKDIKS